MVWATEISANVLGPGGEFVISGTQTGGKPELDASDYARVLEADVAHNRLRSTGETKPSSESLTHALLYQLSRDVVSVVHVHCPRLWGAATRLSLPCTPASAPYGSLAMVDAVRRLWQSGALQQTLDSSCWDTRMAWCPLVLTLSQRPRFYLIGWKKSECHLKSYSSKSPVCRVGVKKSTPSRWRNARCHSSFSRRVA
ncbi:MAG: class II aldolase/adducin family protein [Hahellaceae bacterium]|nr:class II aldolase/adducin family protein [Hahellaceae bacterium]